jgi:hypothetical protein
MPLNLSFSASAKLPLPVLHTNVNVSAAGSYTSKGANPHAKAYLSNGHLMNNMGYLANPTRSAQIAANNAGALTRSEASRIGLPLGGRK